MYVFNKPKTPAPRPNISAPIAGSGRQIATTRDGSFPANPIPGASTGNPHNEYPHNRPVPNTVALRREDGSVNLLHLPPGATLSGPMPQAQAHRAPVDIKTMGWPQNNRDTDKLRGLKDAHQQALQELHLARNSPPHVSESQKRTLEPAQLRARKREVADAQKPYRDEINRLEKTERQARRNLEVFESRFSKELRAEYDYRTGAGVASGSSHGSMASPADAATVPEAPTRSKPAPAPFGRSKAPGLDTIRESTTPPIMEMPPGAEVSHGRMETKSTLGPAENHVFRLQEELRTAKNAYYGMKSEKALHSADDLNAARTRYKHADAALSSFRKDNRYTLSLEGQGQRLPDLEQLRGMLHPRTNTNYPAFPSTSGLAVTSTPASPDVPRGPSGHHTPMEALASASFTRPPELPPERQPLAQDPIERPSAPAPDHPRNLAAQSAPGPHDRLGLDYYGI